MPPNVETSTGTEVVEEREVKVEGYTVNKHGIFDGDGEVLSQTPIVPCTVLDVEGAYSVRLIFPKLFGSGVAEVVVPLDEAYNPNKLLRICKFGADVSSENSRQLSKYLKTVITAHSTEIPVVKVSKNCGWHEDLFVPYDTEYEISDKHREAVLTSISQSGELNEWCQAFSMVAENDYARIVLAASCMAPLLRKLDLRENPILDIVGPTCNGKSVLLQFALSVWGDPRSDVTFRCANNTNYNIETRAKLFCDLPIFMDEAETVNFTSHELMQWAQGQERGRNQEIVVDRYTNVFILSSERTILPSQFNQGLLNRLFELAMDAPLGTDDFITEFVDKFQYNFGHIGPVFIAAVKSQAADNGLNTTFRGITHELRNYIRGNNLQVSFKIIRILGAMLLADRILVDSLEVLGYEYPYMRIESVIGVYLNGRSESPDECAFYNLCYSAIRGMADSKHNLNVDSTGFVDGEAKCAYITRRIANDYRAHFANWLSKGKIAKYCGDKYYAPIMNCQFLTIKDSNAVAFLSQR